MKTMKSKVMKTGPFGVDKGGKAMAGFSGAAKAEAGKTSVGGRSGNKSFSPDTGGKAMAGFTGASPARPK
jgi:hypothetical protein